MNNKKKRASLVAMLMMMQINFLIFSFDAVLMDTNANIKDALLPIAKLQIVSFVLLLVVLLVAYFCIQRTKQGKTDVVMPIVVCVFEALLWAAGVYQMYTKGTLGGKEWAVVGVMYGALLAFTICHCKLKAKKLWISDSILLGVEVILVTVVSILYKNDIMAPEKMITMYALNAAFVALAIWGKYLWNFIASIIVVLAQAIISILEFQKLSKSKTVLSAISSLVESKTLTQILTLVIMVFAALLIVTIVLQFTGELRVLGKISAVSFTCIIIFVIGTLSGLETKAEGTLAVDKTQTVDSVDYCVYVAKESPYKTAADLLDATIGIHYENDKEEMTEAIAEVKKQADGELTLVEKETISELLQAYEEGTIDAFLIARSQLDDMDAELEMRWEDRVFSEEVIPLITISIKTTVQEEEHAPDINNSSNINENSDLTTEPFIMYFSGIDVYGKITTKSRSDVNVLAVVNPVTKEIALISTPRDAYVDIPGKTTSLRDKLTHAGNYGVAYSMATLENLYGIDIDFYLRVNFTSVETIIDLIGGVDAYSYYDFTSRFHHWHFNKGYNHMNGSQALAFARERKTVAGGDVTRGKHHLELIKAIFNQVTKTTVLANYESLLSAVADNFQTDLTASQIAALVGMQMNDAATWHFTQYAAVGDGLTTYCASYSGGKLWVSVLKEESVAKASDIIARVLNGEHIEDGSVTYDE